MGRITRATTIGTSNINTDTKDTQAIINNVRGTYNNPHAASAVTTAPPPPQSTKLHDIQFGGKGNIHTMNLSPDAVAWYEKEAPKTIVKKNTVGGSLHDIQFGGKGTTHTMNLSPEAIAWYEKEAPKTIVKKNTNKIITNEIPPTIPSPNQFSIKDYDTGVVRTTNVVSPVSDKGGIQAAYNTQSFDKFQNQIQGMWFGDKRGGGSPMDQKTFQSIIKRIDKSHLSQAQKDKMKKNQNKKRDKFNKMHGGMSSDPWEIKTGYTTTSDEQMFLPDLRGNEGVYADVNNSGKITNVALTNLSDPNKSYNP